MNTPLDPRTGDRRQKALRARLQAMAQNNGTAKALLGKMGHSRGQVRSNNPRGSGVRIAQNGMTRPGGLDFLQALGFGLQARGMGPAGGPEMRQAGHTPVNRHASNPLPTQRLDNDPRPADPGRSSIPGEELPVGAVSDPTPPWVSEMNQAGLQPIDPGTGPTAIDGLGAPSGPSTASGLIPLGGGRYYDPATGVIHGSGGLGGNVFAV